VIGMPRPDARRLVLRNDLAELERLAGWVQIWSNESVVSSDVSFAVQLCLEEAVANVIMYGGPKDDPLEIAVEVERNAGTLVALIEDNGRQFDPTKVPSPRRAISLDDAKIGDVGIHLMRSFANDMSYERRDGRNRLTLRFLEPQPGASPAG
jgi:anti-sigma regulatory factor (Ser/Thr protein kinase)